MALPPLPIGIFVNDILEAVPIDKYFELFKPNAGGDGGYIRISMDFIRDGQQRGAAERLRGGPCRQRTEGKGNQDGREAKGMIFVGR